MPLECGDRVNDYLVLEKLDPVNEVLIGRSYPKSLYEASKMADISLGALRHAAKKGNRLIVRRRDKQPFKMTWCNSHDACFEFKREKERLERKRRIDEEVAKKKEERLWREKWERNNK